VFAIVVFSLIFLGLRAPLSVQAVALTVTNISPNNGSIAGGTVITVTGSGFKGDYERVEALIFDGASYIDTGVSQLNHSINARFLMDTSNTSTDNVVFGNSDSSGSQRFGFARVAGASGAYTAYAGATASTALTALVNVGVKNDMTLDWARSFHVNGSMGAAFGTAPTVSANIWIGRSASPAGYYRGTFYQMRTYSGTLIDHNFVPVRKTSTGEYGVVDLATRQFHGNVGSGTITGGTTVSGTFTIDATIPGGVSPDTQTQVLIDGRPCTGVDVVSDTELTCHTPSGLSLGKKNVTVYIDNINQFTVNNGFEYALRLNSIYPKFGPVTGGNTIEIDGGVYSTPPEQYMSVEGIVFDGDSWLETGFSQIGSTKFVMDFKYNITACSTPTTHNMGMLGARDTSSGNAFNIWACTSGNMRSDYNSASGTTYAISNFGTVDRFSVVKDNGSTILYNSNGTLKANLANVAFVSMNNPVEMLIGSLSHGGAYGTNGATKYSSFKGVVYGAQICKDPNYKDSSNNWAVPPGTVYQINNALCGSSRVLVRDYRPAQRETDGVYGFYDMVTGEFIENAGFGTFSPSGTTLTNELEVPVTLNVTVGGQVCSNPTLVSETKISCVVPPSNLGGNGEGRVDVEVFANGVQATPGTLDASDYYYGNPMVVDTISPIRGPIAGGQVVTITGSNFFQASTVDATGYWQSYVVTIGGSICNIASASDITNTTIVCTTASHTGGISDIFVDNGESDYTYRGSIDPITGAITSGYLYEDVLLSISPSSGLSVGGVSVTIKGNNFLLSGNTKIFFGGIAATNIVVVNSTTITATTPAHAPGAVDILVLQDNYAATLSRNAPGAFTYTFQGATSGLSPDRGYISGGDSVVINGAGFDVYAPATVTFDGISATNVVVLSPTQIRVTTPAHAVGVVDVDVEQFGITNTITNGFTFINHMSISSISPNRGTTDGGTIVTISGESFIPANATAATAFISLGVTLGGAPCLVASASDLTDTIITCTTGAHVVDLVDLVVDNGLENDTLIDAFSYYGIELTLSVSSPTINLAPNSTGQVDLTLGARTTWGDGYSLDFAATGGDNKVYCSTDNASYYSATTSNTLDNGSWGYQIGTSAATNAWLGIPTTDTSIFTTNNPSANSGANFDYHKIWFGARGSWNLPVCLYQGSITYTLSINLNSGGG